MQVCHDNVEQLSLQRKLNCQAKQISECTNVHHRTVGGVIIDAETLAEALGNKSNLKLQELPLNISFLGED